ncbi:MAG TPA: ester cyclase [Anaeromyxobacteraceae bacterium]|nr:ester cyclase [Anaeromyxobacteraceae bacterium]
MVNVAELNKAVVLRFNEEFLARGDDSILAELMHPEFVNRTAMPGVDPGVAGMRYVVKDVLHRGLSELRVELDDQLADGDRVATRKRILGRHTGELLGAVATGREVCIAVFDIVRLRDGRYLEHWGLNTLPLVVGQLKAAP